MSRSQWSSLTRFAKNDLGLSAAELLRRDWFFQARLAQYPLRGGYPATWLVSGGRGAGKTRLGAEWVIALARGLPPYTPPRASHGRIALVGETLGDVREVMIEGPSGIVTVARGDRPRFEPSRRRLVWESGAVALIFSSEDPESLRGPQFDAAWCDELAKWRHPDACFDMLQFGLRLGTTPRQLITTTPRPLPLMRRLMGDEAVKVTRMRTRDNGANLAPGFIGAVEARYGGTRLGRQELDGELIEDREDALWTRAQLEAGRAQPVGGLTRIVVAVDPPATATARSDACGIVAAGLDQEGNVVVLEDATLERASPATWAARAIAVFRDWDADCIVAETNQGGDMVVAVLRAVDPSVPIRTARAQRGKWLRAEPVAALYEQGKVRHRAPFAALEDEMCDFGRDGLSGARSPDRVDALVWAVTELMSGHKGVPRVRGLDG